MKTAPLAEVDSRESVIKVWCQHSQLLDPAGLKHHPQNNNVHSAKQLKIMKAVLKANGFREAIVVSAKTGHIVAGHARAIAAVEMGMKFVPVDLQHFDTLLDEIKHLTADNELARHAQFDADIFINTKEQFEKDLGKSAFQTSFFNPNEFGLDAYPTDEEEEGGDKKERRVWSVLEDGDKWKIGNHTVICGEFHNPEEQAYLQKFLKGWRAIAGVDAVHVKTKQGYKELTDERREKLRGDFAEEGGDDE